MASFRRENTLILAGIALARDKAAAEEAFETFSGTGNQNCFARAIAADLSAIGDVGEPDLRRLPAGELGDERRAAQIAMPVRAEGETVDVTFDLVFARAGRGIAFDLFADVTKAFDPALRRKLSATSAERLAAVLG